MGRRQPRAGCEERARGGRVHGLRPQDSAPVGTAGLLGILHAHGNAEFAIFLGERRGQGLGTEATRLVLDFAFHVLQLRNVLLETLEWNAAGLTAYERAGFRRIGVRRGARISRGRPTDIVLMDAVPQDFGASVLRCSQRAPSLRHPDVRRPQPPTTPISSRRAAGSASWSVS